MAKYIHLLQMPSPKYIYFFALQILLFPFFSNGQLASNSPICSGNTIALEVSKIGDTYQWTGPNDFSSTTTNNRIFIPSTESSSGTYSVIVDSSGFKEQFSEDVVVISAPQKPTIAGVKAVCVGEKIEIRTTNHTENLVKWENEFGATISNTFQFFISNANPSHAADYSVFFTKDGCPGEELNFTIDVYQLPNEPEINGLSNICVGDKLDLIGNDNGGANIDSTVWILPNNIRIKSKDFSIEKTTIENGGEYSFIAYNKQCASPKATKMITLHPVPEAVKLRSNSFTFCEGEKVNITPQNLSPEYNVEWTLPDKSFFLGNSLLIENVLEEQAGTYKVRFVNNFCVGENFNFNLNVNIAPEPLIIEHPEKICSGVKLEMKANSEGSTEFEWQGPHGRTYEDSVWIVESPDTTFEGIYSVTSSNGLCESKTVNFFLEIASTPSLIALKANDPICENETLKIWAAADQSESSFLWEDSDGNIFGGDTLIFKEQPYHDSLIFHVTPFKGNCIAQSDSIVIDIARPIKDLKISSNSPVCERERLRLFVKEYDLASYKWNGPKGFTSDTNKNVIINPDTLATGNYTAIAWNVCGADTVSRSLTVFPIPYHSIVGDTSICEDPKVAINERFYIKADPNLVFYQWSTGEELDSILVQKPGAYVVRGYNEYGCSSLAMHKVENKCLPEFHAPLAFTPNGDNINDKYRVIGHNVKDIEMVITNKQGEVLFSTTDAEEGWDGTYKGKAVPDGYYFYYFKYFTSHRISPYADEKTGYFLLLRP